MSQKRTEIGELHIGSRLLYRSKNDWRTAAVARTDEEFVTLTVASPKGRNYRLRRKCSTAVLLDGPLPILLSEEPPTEYWKENFGEYDRRW
ncbi:MAG: hypothetical protein HKN33_03965 [Pyrinomonadaceae bacterium]|nr:hypothetical protein [Pyrinomonadaceae bacterium]